MSLVIRQSCIPPHVCDVELVNMRCPGPSSFDGNVTYVFPCCSKSLAAHYSTPVHVILLGSLLMSMGGVRGARTMSTEGVRGVHGVLQGGIVHINTRCRARSIMWILLPWTCCLFFVHGKTMSTGEPQERMMFIREDNAHRRGRCSCVR